MTKWILAAGAAALAVTTPALADNHKGGKGNGGGNAKSMKADRGPSMKEARGDRGPSMKADRGPAMKAEKMERGQRGNDRVKVREAKGPKFDAKQRGNGAAGNGGMDEGVRLVERRFDGPFLGRTNVGLGCPPGLDRKDNGCLPPGQAKKLLGAALPAAFDNSMIPYAYRSWYRDNDDYRYRMGDGFIYRVNRDNSLVDGLIPLFGSGYYALGDPWPEPYDFYNVPYQYRSYWADGSNYSYRYGDGAIYRIDRQPRWSAGSWPCSPATSGSVRACPWDTTRTTCPSPTATVIMTRPATGIVTMMATSIASTRPRA